MLKIKDKLEGFLWIYGFIFYRYTARHSKTNVTYRQLLELDQALATFGKSSLRVPQEYLEEAKRNQSSQTSSDSDLFSRLCQIYVDPDYIASGVITDNDLYVGKNII